ncbi:GNAT family N-acetyltransferase [Lysobacter capsici]|uniref:GNAT family N-acetyltransferase n=1 Tax=Lysobacter capsici TaxID=435897 RepID=UPI001780F65E|nr:GNAT family N-acetyltransferase [Lysobacter capsici]UOF14755.1 GNAT family N-acetyltransferase [Lysobacter capsici]
MPTIQTERLLLSELTPDDAGFILQLLNEPSFLDNIGDRGVRDLDGAVRYILDGPVNSYARYGHGLLRVSLRDSGEPIGMCGLLKRDTLPDADLGYAFLPRHWSRGYAIESGTAVLQHAREVLALPRVLGLVDPANQPSIKVLERLGLRFERELRMGEEDLHVFTTEAAA